MKLYEAGCSLYRQHLFPQFKVIAIPSIKNWVPMEAVSQNLYIKVLNIPCRVAWFKSLKVTLSLANTLEVDNTQTIALPFKSHEVAPIY